MKQRIELITNLVVIALAAFLVVAFARSGLAPWRKLAAPASMKVGDTLPAIAGMNNAPGGTTLILAIRNGCHYCEDSMPFYAELAALHRAGKLKPALLAVLPDDAAVARAFLSENHVALPFSAGIPLDEIRVAGTPTLIWVNAQRRVLRAWVGEQPAAGQRAILAALTTELKN